MLSDAEMFERMKKGWKKGKPFTVCGNGSLPDATYNVQHVLPEWCRKYHLRVVNDAGAGDMAWRRNMVWDVEYHPFDLIPREGSVRAWDITRDALPECDLIVCRMVLNHLDDERVALALGLFRQSARYLAATQFDGPQSQRARDFTRLDLRRWLGDPIESTEDGREPTCRLALWRI